MYIIDLVLRTKDYGLRYQPCHRLARLHGVEVVGVDVVAQPFADIVMFGVFRVSQDIQQVYGTAGAPGGRAVMPSLVDGAVEAWLSWRSETSVAVASTSTRRFWTWESGV